MTQRTWCAIVMSFAVSGAGAWPADAGNPEACETAVVIQSLPFDSGIIDNSNFAGSAPGGSCDPATPAQMAQDLWYRWTAIENSQVNIQVETGFYTGVAQVQTGTSCASLSLVTCALGAAPGIIPLSFQATAGQTYFLQAGRRGGPGMITAWTTVRIQSLPPNDECTGAIMLMPDVPAVGNTADATSNPTDPSFMCINAGPGAGSLWYSFVAPAERVVLTTGDTVSAAYPQPKTLDSLIAVYSGACGALTQIACNGQVSFAPQGLGFTAHATVNVDGLTVGETYLVQIAAKGQGAVLGTLVLRMSIPVQCPLASAIEPETCGLSINNDCTDPTPISPGATMCGTIWSVDGFAEIDSYLLKLPRAAIVPITLRSSIPLRLRIQHAPECFGPQPLLEVQTDCVDFNCEAQTSIPLAPGWYHLVIDGSSELFETHLCDTGRNDYLLSLGSSLNCEGDANGDQIVNFDDITEVIVNWLRICP